MTSVPSMTGLTRLVVVAPQRRLELAFPDHLPLAQLLPGVLRYAGEDLADDGLAHEGWTLRRGDGTSLDAAVSLAAQGLRDGEVLHLVPRRLDWPETTYDDVVDVISEGFRRRGKRWEGNATRVAGLEFGGVALAVGLVVIVMSGPPWTVPAMLALGICGLLLVAGTLLSRAFADASAGADVAAAAMPYAFAGGLMLLLANDRLLQVGAPHLLIAAALLLVAAVAGHLGAGDHGRLFVAGMVAGAAGSMGGAAALWFPALGASGAAALVLTAALLFSPIAPAVAMRVGRIPLPDLPRTPEDLVADAPQPERSALDAATARADEVLTGTIFGAALAGAVCLALLALSGSPTAWALAAVVSVAFLLRARFHIGVRHRVPMLVVGGAGLAMVGVVLGVAGGADRVVPSAAAITAVALVALVAGLSYRRRPPSPRLGRYGDVLDVLLTLAVVPLAADVVGLYAYVRGLGG